RWQGDDADGRPQAPGQAALREPQRTAGQGRRGGGGRQDRPESDAQGRKDRPEGGRVGPGEDRGEGQAAFRADRGGGPLSGRQRAEAASSRGAGIAGRGGGRGDEGEVGQLRRLGGHG